MRAFLELAFYRLVSLLAWALTALLLSLLLSGDVHVPSDTPGRARRHLRDIEFDFVTWTVVASSFKVSHAGLSAHAYISEQNRSEIVREFFALRRQLDDVERAIAAAYADPGVVDVSAATADLRLQEQELRGAMRLRQPLTESIFQEQLSTILAEEGLALAGQPIPPVAYTMTPLPYALIISPRGQIRQDANMDISGELTLDERVALENAIAADLDVSTLTVPLGGIGTYPTMIGPSSNINWVASVVAHEWIHNYLTLRPLGLLYFDSPELRTMNETAAEMLGDELGALLIARYYPDMAPAPPGFRNVLRRDATLPEDRVPVFDFQAAMRETRVTADQLLASGQVEQAEDYMEARRRYMWENGYQIRRLNQAYFAFYGAYAAGPGGAAGEDPVGAAVRLLRRRSPSAHSFLNTISWFTSFEQLQIYLGLPTT
jgi:hypothetical protein